MKRSAIDIIIATSCTGTFTLFSGRSSFSIPSVSAFGVVAVFLTDPEHKTPVGRGRAVNDRAMWDMWRDEHDISEMDRVNFGSDLNADITFHKKIKFIIIVGMQVYFGQIVVIIIVKFEIP